MNTVKRTKAFSILLTTLFASSLLTPPSANAAYTVIPKVGQCFQYTKAQVSAKYAPKNPIPFLYVQEIVAIDSSRVFSKLFKSEGGPSYGDAA